MRAEVAPIRESRRSGDKPDHRSAPQHYKQAHLAFLMLVLSIHFLLLAGLLVIMSLSTARAEAPVPKEYQVNKAAFLDNFAKFVGWPDRCLATEESPIA